MIQVNPNQASLNRERFKVAPTLEQIEMCIKYMNTKDSIFEIVLCMPTGTMKRIRYSNRTLPSSYWHIVYIVLWLRNQYDLPPYPKKK